MRLQAQEGRGVPATTAAGAAGKGSPRQRQGRTAPPTAGLQTSDPQNRERVRFGGFKPPSLWLFVSAAPGN